MLTDLADVLRAGGLRVVEVPGWKTRSADGNDFVGVKGILCHWTATNPAASGDYPTLNTILNGNGDTPGPLSQLGLGRDGTWYVIAAGVCWHAGNTDRVASDNYHAIGIEAEYHPAQGAWPEAQQRSYERGVAALQRHYRVPLDEVRGHYEAAIPYGRKDDPKTLPGGMPGFRQRVDAVDLDANHIGGEDMLIQKLTGKTGVGTVALVSGGIVSAVDAKWAQETNQKAGGGLIIGVSEAVWEDHLGKSRALEAVPSLLAQVLAELKTLNAKQG